MKLIHLAYYVEYHITNTGSLLYMARFLSFHMAEGILSLATVLIYCGTGVHTFCITYTSD